MVAFGSGVQCPEATDTNLHDLGGGCLLEEGEQTGLDRRESGELVGGFGRWVGGGGLGLGWVSISPHSKVPRRGDASAALRCLLQRPRTHEEVKQKGKNKTKTKRNEAE